MDISARSISLADRPHRAIRTTSFERAGKTGLHCILSLSQTSVGIAAYIIGTS
jgi:hypothetical protein